MAKRRKKKLKKTVKFVTFLFLVGLCLIGFGLYKAKFDKKPVEKKKVVKKIKKKKEPSEYSFNLFMVGDALIHYGVYADAKQSDGSYDFKPMLQYTKPISSKYDLAYYNQETILGGASLGYSSYPMFNSPQEVGDAFIDSGFDLVSLATNHTMDKREEGVLKSVEYWKKHPEVITSGQWSSEEERTASITKVHEKNGIKYAFISYTMWNNGLPTPVGKEYLNNEYSEEKAKADIESVRDKVDVVIVAMHWGTEYSLGVDVAQEKETEYLSSLGVDLIIGAHPHVVEPVEYVNDNKTFVIYSLGNFISDQDGTERLTGLMMDVTIKKKINKDKTSTITVENPHAELVYTAANRGSGYNSNFRLYSYKNLNDSILPGYKTYYEKYKAVVSERYPELQWGLLGEA